MFWYVYIILRHYLKLLPTFPHYSFNFCLFIKLEKCRLSLSQQLSFKSLLAACYRNSCSFPLKICAHIQIFMLFSWYLILRSVCAFIHRENWGVYITLILSCHKWAVILVSRYMADPQRTSCISSLRFAIFGIKCGMSREWSLNQDCLVVLNHSRQTLPLLVNAFVKFVDHHICRIFPLTSSWT